MGLLSKMKLLLRSMASAIDKSEEHLSTLPLTEARLREVVTTLGQTEQHLDQIAAMMMRDRIVQVLSNPKYADPLRLERSGFRVHSQYDEDGIIDEIFQRIGTTNRTCIEFGAGNGTENCTGFLLMQGWRALWMDGNDALLPTVNIGWPRELARNQLIARQTFITADNIDELIGDAGFTGEIDLLVIDLDANDYHVLDKISVVSPRVICAEYNSNIPAHVDWKMERNDSYVWEGIDDRTGASLKALELLLAGKGYALVGCSAAGVNAFFVKRELVDGKFAEPFTAENHYNNWRFFYPSRSAVSNWREGRTI